MIMAGTETRGRDYDSPIQGKKKVKSPAVRRGIYVLINHVLFFLHFVFILIEKQGYRLIVIHNGKLQTDKCYATLRSAKIAFSRLYRKKSWKKNAKPKWSTLLCPDNDWINKKLKFISVRGET